MTKPQFLSRFKRKIYCYQRMFAFHILLPIEGGCVILRRAYLREAKGLSDTCSPGCNCEALWVLEYDVMYGRSVPTFQRNHYHGPTTSMGRSFLLNVGTILPDYTVSHLEDGSLQTYVIFGI